MNAHISEHRVTVPSILARKASSSPIAAVTAYDFTFAQLFDQAGVDLILVGDSLGSVIQGHPNTLPVTLEEMIYHCRCVTRGVQRALVVGDMPFLSYQVSIEQGVLTAGRLLKEGGVAAVKLEGGIAVAALIERLSEIDIPVMGHVGLTPQSFHRMGGHKVQGKQRNKGDRLKPGTRERIIEDALAVERAGAFCVVLEGIPADLAGELRTRLQIPTIGIGAGPSCDGQIMVSYDLLGLTPEPRPSFVKDFAGLGPIVRDAVERYADEVRDGRFPSKEKAAVPVTLRSL